VETSVYARPEPPRIILRPALVTLALHALLLYLLTVNWGSQVEVTVRPKPAPRVINATLVDASDLQPKPKPKPAAKPKPAPKAAAKPRPTPQPRPTQKTTPQPKAEPRPAPKAAPAPKVEPEPRLTAEELAALTRADLARAVEREEAAQQAATADQLSASYQALIQQTITRYWSRPPSARNGMETLLSLQLVPTGEVVSVTVLKSSGDTAFDRSAVNAVQKAERFPELANLPPRVFERDFRRLRLLFKPEDLRY
jgi:colicin import membrane protein